MGLFSPEQTARLPQCWQRICKAFILEDKIDTGGNVTETIAFVFFSTSDLHALVEATETSEQLADFTKPKPCRL